MDGQEYLNQISVANRPVKPVKPVKQAWYKSKYAMLGLGAVVALIVIIIIGAVLGSNKSSEKDLGYALKLHLVNTSEIIQNYQPEVKSSDLRSSSASLYSVLSNTDRELTEYLTEKYNFKEKDIDKKVVEQATLEKDGLEAELFNAKINGNLDRIYAHKMTYEISMFMSEEARLINATKNSQFKEVLTSSYGSLENLYESFDSFSETK